MATQIGMIVGVETGRIYATVQPDRNVQLDNPRYLLMHVENEEKLMMVKVLETDFVGVETDLDRQALVEARRP
jgi:translation initiation factor IF-1